MSDRLARNAFYLTVASIGQKVLAFAYFLLLARALQPELTGLYSVALSLATAFYVVADLGLPSVIIRDVAKDPDHALPLVRRGLAFKLPPTFIAIVLANVAAWMLGYEPQARLLVALASGALFCDSLSVFYYGVLRGLHVLAYESVGMFAGQLLTLVVGSAVLWLHPSLPLLILVLTIGSLFNAILSSSQVVRRLGASALIPQWSREGFWKLFRASLPFFLAAAFVKLFSTLDLQFLKYFHGNAVVGVYSVAYKFTYAFQFLPLAFVAALYPGMSALVGKKDTQGLAELFEKAIRYMLLLSVPLAIGLAFIAEEAVDLVGASYAAAVPVLAFLPFVLIPSFLDFPIGSLLNAAGRQNTKTALFGATLLVNFVLDLLLVPTQGMIGAAVASVVSVSLLVIGGFFFVPQVITGYRLRRALWVALPIVASGIVMRLAAHGIRLGFDRIGVSGHLELALVVAAAAVAYVLALILTRAVGPADWEVVKKMMGKGTPDPNLTPNS